MPTDNRKKILAAFTLIVIGLLTGVFMTAQARTQPFRVTNPVSPFVELRETKENLLSSQTLLKDEAVRLNTEISNLQNEITRGADISTDIVETVEALRTRAGMTQLEGDGIMITLGDSPNERANPNSIAHASDLRDIVELSRSRDAQAIAVNGERIVQTTSIDSVVNTVMINNFKTVPPFEITIIGDRKLLLETFNDAALLPHLFARVRDENLIYTIEQKKRLRVSPYTQTFRVRWAQVQL